MALRSVVDYICTSD